MSLTPVMSAPSMVTPLQVIANGAFVYVVDNAQYGQAMGAIWRYEPAKDAWLKLVDARAPIVAVGDPYVFWTEQVEVGVPYHRRLSRMIR
jgi:hypothetical protein